MIATLKILHFLALAIGLGGGVASAIVGAKITANNPATGAPVQKLLGRMAFAALIVLWITGIWLYRTLYPGAVPSPWFWIKMAAVLVLTAAALAAQYTAFNPGPDTPARMKRLGMITTGAAALSVIFAGLAFT